VKLLKRLLDFKSLLLFLIKCTEKKAAMKKKDRQGAATPEQIAHHSRSCRQGTRSRIDAGDAASPTAGRDFSLTSLCGLPR